MRLLNPSQTIDKITAFLKQEIKEAGFKNGIVAVSGGIDSAVSLSLSVRALGASHTHAVLLPYDNWHDESVGRAQELIKKLKIPQENVSIINIKPTVETFVIPSEVEGSRTNVRQGNIMARIRMTVLFDLAKARNALVVGTENKSEHLLGYFTRFGDEASDIEPIRAFYKTEIYELARFLSIPQSIIAAKPTAGLWHGQTDEGEFGFSYQDADEILSLVYDEGRSSEEVQKKGFKKEVVENVLKRVQENNFKHHLPKVFEL